jgi:hypothetical protein
LPAVMDVGIISRNVSTAKRFHWVSRETLGAQDFRARQEIALARVVMDYGRSRQTEAMSTTQKG